MEMKKCSDKIVAAVDEKINKFYAFGNLLVDRLRNLRITPLPFGFNRPEMRANQQETFR